jgi:aspartate beta-hydroxylase
MQINGLVQTAQQFMRAGRPDDAARTWDQVRALAPSHPQALFFLGQHALMRNRNAPLAVELFQRAAAADPKSAVIPLNLSFAYRALGDAENEMAALLRALAIDAYFYPALLYKGILEERQGNRRLAAQTYKNVLTIAPPDDQLPEEMKKSITHARDIVRENAAELESFLSERIGRVRSRHAPEELWRFDECRDVAVGTKKIYTQQPTLLHFPGLPATQYYERKHFPWLEELEAATPAIREEVVALMKEAKDFAPYVRHPPGVPLNQWADLNFSPKWSAYFLWQNDIRNDAHCLACPRTAAAVEASPLADIPNFAPTVFFSALEPKTRIPPHTGVTNARLTLHLPLIVPEGCWFRVGNDTREWQEGKAWVFDDTIEHEAYNPSGELRVILIFDVWNPHLSAAERNLVRELLVGMNAYYDSNTGAL